MQGEGGAPGTPPNRTATTLLEDRRGRTMRLYRARRKHTGHRSARPERAAGGFSVAANPKAASDSCLPRGLCDAPWPRIRHVRIARKPAPAAPGSGGRARPCRARAVRARDPTSSGNHPSGSAVLVARSGQQPAAPPSLRRPVRKQPAARPLGRPGWPATSRPAADEGPAHQSMPA